MTKPAVTTILDAMELRLKNIKKSNDYFVDVKTVRRGSLEPFKGYDLPAINYWPSLVTQAANVYNDDTKELRIFVEAHALTRDRSYVDVADELAADIMHAVNRSDDDPEVTDSNSLDLDELVSDLAMDNYTYFIGEGQQPFCGVLVELVIRYSADTLNDMLGIKI